VASTFNEELLSVYMRQHAKTKEEKIFLINQKLEDIKATLFRQTMFAEFELLIHEQVEKNLPITPEFLKQTYYELNRFYFGEGVIVDKEIEMEWARVPHFYYNFYVYQYATGISAALALANKVLTGGDKDRKGYLDFLKSGSSRYPIDTLKLAGVDMASPQPVESAIDQFASLTQELALLL
jgi:oligoendopeptidase F